jgi:hypothetical protein
VFQVDGEGNLIEDAFINAAGVAYKEEPLKALAKDKAPDCFQEANKTRNGR